MKVDLNSIKIFLKTYFNIFPDKENEKDVIERVSKDASFRGANLWVLIFAIFLASLGLNVNSTAVIIGAMLISPLMGPIVGMGLAMGIQDFELLKRSVKNYFITTIISVLTAMVYFLISPLSQAQSELLARTSPTLYDVLIALFGGAAGIVAMSTKGKGNVIPGVAIATALMPPLCTAGFGLATGSAQYFFGAFYLFFINSVFIALATYLGSRLMKFEHKVVTDKERHKIVSRWILAIVVITMTPATIMTINIINKSIFDRNVQSFINKEIKQSGTKILSYDISKQDTTIRIIAVGKEISESSIASASEKLKENGLGKYKIQVIQTANSSENNDNGSDYTKIIQNERILIDELEKELNSYKTIDSYSEKIKSEIQVLYPNISSIALAQANNVSTKRNESSKKIYAIIKVDNKDNLSEEENKIKSWLKARIKANNIELIIR
ncbi:MAG: DUF389 domain-containing protein [Bacteroidales bacterium]|nr:DUF389 domain-containing protein [Bacteroidales bacterium]